jgi:hypothetical protein
MAASQSILWTTLPHGRVTLPSGRSALRVSLFVSPRLTPTAAQVLKPFKLFLDWPAVVATLQFKLTFDGGPSTDLTRLPGEDPLDSAVWKRLFDEDTFVRKFTFTDLKNEKIRTFPAADILAFMQELYGETADKFGADFPPHGPNDNSPLTKLKELLGALSTPDRQKRLEYLVDGMLEQTKAVPQKPSGFSSAAEAAFFQAQRFYDRKKRPLSNEYRESPDPKHKPVAVKLPEFDFHQALAAFGDYPRLMRRLGLVIDCVLPEPASLPPTGRVRVEVKSSDPAINAQFATDKQGWTAYALSRTAFRARAVDGVETDLTRGQLDLRGAVPASNDAPQSDYVISQLDVDGSALKTLHTVSSLMRLDNPSLTNYRSPTSSDLPALRTAGLAIYKRARAIGTHAHLVRAATLQTALIGPSRPEFFADDLLRGYRLDVWDDVSKNWHTLCLRHGDYFLTKRGDRLQIKLLDEGYVKSASAARGDVAVETDLYLHERLAAFDGWSLVAVRPGKTLAANPAEGPVPPPAGAETEFGLATQFSPPAGSLPRLRFGRSYRLRVRLVDIAGNSLDFEKLGDAYASPKFLFTRFEPLSSPALLPRARMTEGESLEHLVIRSDYNRTAAAYAIDPDVNAALAKVRARLGIDETAAASYAYLPQNERHVAPPKTSQLEAERHGRFDEFMGPGKDHAKGYRLAAREAGSFLSKTWVNLATGATEPIPGLDIEVVPATGDKPTDLDSPKRKEGDPLQEGEYVLHKEAQLIVPYLPDPLAVGVAFVGLPGFPAGEAKIVMFDGTWPELRPFRIRIVERPGVMQECAQMFAGDGAPKWDSEIDAGSTERVLNVYLPKGASAEVRYSSVVLKEGAENMGVWRWLEQRGGLKAAARHKILTGRHWMFTPWRKMKLVHAVQHPLCRPTITIWTYQRLRGDTFTNLRGIWHLSMKSTSKVALQANWSEPLDDITKPTWQMLERSGNVAELKMDPSAPDDLEIGSKPGAILDDNSGVRHEFGDTKHRMIRYRLKGTSRFREYFPSEITQEDAAITRTGPEVLLNIPSSERPAAPSPLYVLPTFRWEETALPNNGVSRTRRGNGLRIYLERPWWSSGDNERLGVVFRQGPVANGDKAFVTQWGLDPLFDSAAPLSGPTVSSFPLASEVNPGVSLEEKLDNQTVYSVAGHTVEWDPERKLWFADIEVKAGISYFPFIRLAVARFQPSSLMHCHVSRVVQTDFVQLAPDRTCKLTWLNPTKVRIQIYGQAPTKTHVSDQLKKWGIDSTLPPSSKVTNRSGDVGSIKLTGAQAKEYFKVGQLEFLGTGTVGAGGMNPGDYAAATEPAELSSQPGLNEYTVTLETLPEDGSKDFGWTPVAGVVPQKPFAPSKSPAKFDPDLSGAAVERSGTTGPKITIEKKASTSRGTAKATKTGIGAHATKVGTGKAGGFTTAGGGQGLEFEQADLSHLERPPLWEGDITLPPSSDNRPRRLVVREYEVFFRTFLPPNSERGELPIARRLVYADIHGLPGPTP